LACVFGDQKTNKQRQSNSLAGLNVLSSEKVGGFFIYRLYLSLPHDKINVTKKVSKIVSKIEPKSFI